MPRGEKFWNPYRLIPIRDKIEKKPPFTDEKFKGTSGLISCTLENLTMLFVGKNRDNSQLFLTRNKIPVIPGSSLKGMLRSLTEITGGGCHITDSKGTYSGDYKACEKADKLCIACRMFGMMERGNNAKVHKGNVSIGDAILREEKPSYSKNIQILLSSCGTRHEPFYRTHKTDVLDGKSRKFYFHQAKRTESAPNVPDNLKARAWYIDPLLPGHHFDFEVQFSNLDNDELDLLLYVLALEDNVTVIVGEENLVLRGPLRHKIGNAKPLGMGTGKITIHKLVYLASPKQRFGSLATSENKVFEEESLKNEIARRIQAIVNDTSETMKQLRKIMIWDEKDPRDFTYPEFLWFKNPLNSQKTLKPI